MDPALVPGGSSSGSAVAVARGLVSFALGTDTAGSGRVPAALNNIVGLKPTRGAISARGVVPACRSLDCVSVFAGTVADAWAVTSVAAGYDPEDAWSRRVAMGGMALPPVVRIGVPDAASLKVGSDIAGAAFEAALASFPDFGATLRPVDLAPFFAVAALLYEGAWVAERYAAIRDFIEAQPEALHPVTRQIIEGARRLSAADAFAGQYRLAELARDRGEGLGRDRRAGGAVDPRHLHPRRGRVRPDRRQQPAGHLHQLRQPPRPRARSPCRGRSGATAAPRA